MRGLRLLGKKALCAALGLLVLVCAMPTNAWAADDALMWRDGGFLYNHRYDNVDRMTVYRDVAALPGGGYVAVGCANIGSGTIGLITRVSADGVEETLTYGTQTSGKYTEFHGVELLPDGRVVVAGTSNATYTDGDYDVWGNNDGFDAILLMLELNSDEILWASNYGETERDEFWDVAFYNGKIYAVGYTGPSGSENAFIMQIDSNDGGKDNDNILGGEKNDRFEGVAASSKGIVAVGYSAGTGTDKSGTVKWGFVGSTDAIAVGFDGGLEAQWAKNYGSNVADYFTDVAATSSGFIAVGDSYGTSTDGMAVGISWGHIGNASAPDAIAVELDANGTAVWAKNYGGSYQDVFNSVAVTRYGYVFAGYSGGVSTNLGGDVEWANAGFSDAIAVLADAYGNALWACNVGGAGSDCFNGAASTGDTVVAVGHTYSGGISGIDGAKADDVLYAGLYARFGLKPLPVQEYAEEEPGKPGTFTAPGPDELNRTFEAALKTPTAVLSENGDEVTLDFPYTLDSIFYGAQWQYRVINPATGLPGPWLPVYGMRSPNCTFALCELDLPESSGPVTIEFQLLIDDIEGGGRAISAPAALVLPSTLGFIYAPSYKPVLNSGTTILR